MKLEQHSICQVQFSPAPTAAVLEAFLAKPLRPLRGLLDPKRLQRGGDNTYTYTSRPYGVAGWTLQPRVVLRAGFHQGELLIEQLESRVEGLGGWQDRLSFGLEARLRPCPVAAPGAHQPAALQAEARVWADLPAAAAAVAGPVLHIGLQQLLDRLERRCQRGLRSRAESWLERHG